MADSSSKTLNETSEDLSLILKNPSDPRAQKYFQDYQNALMEAVIKQIEICKSLNAFYQLQQIQEKNAKQSSENKIASEKAKEEIRMIEDEKNEIENLSDADEIQKAEDNTNDRIKEEKGKEAEALSFIDTERAKLDSIETGWKARKDKIFDDLIKKTKSSDEIAATVLEKMKKSPLSISQILENNPSIQQAILQGGSAGKEISKGLNTFQQLEFLRLYTIEATGVKNPSPAELAAMQSKVNKILKEYDMFSVKSNDDKLSTNDIKAYCQISQGLSRQQNELSIIQAKLEKLQETLEALQRKRDENRPNSMKMKPQFK
ncbi:MAG: hypothetical protein JO149_09880 [Gammaproteobacteria bacterium]|nr:hypothetical protein [Gammaproteobacteria bacterium]